MRKADIAYAAGFFDGEGAVSLSLQKGKYLRVEVATSQNTIDVLLWYRRNFGGSIYGSPERCFQWKIFGEKAIDFLKLIQPYLFVKQVDAVEAVQVWESRDDLGRMTELIRARKERYANRRNYAIAERARKGVRRSMDANGDDLRTPE